MKLTKEEVKQNRLNWFEALESGKYKQIIGTLYVPKRGYCCLGVALRLQSGKKDFFSYIDTNDLTLGEEFTDKGRKFLAMTDNQMQHALHMNDSDKKSFIEIAAYFRKLWKLPKENTVTTKKK